MKILPGSPPLPHGVRSSFRNRNRISEIQVCSDSSHMVNLSSVSAAEEVSIDDDVPGQRAYSSRSSSSVDGDYDDVISGNPDFCKSHPFKSSSDLKDDDEDGDGDDVDDEDDHDGMQWANSRRPLETAPQSFGYGDRKGSYAGKMAAGKENKVKISCKFASRVQQHAGPIRPNSGPFSGPLKAPSKPTMAPSIIPVNLMCKKMLGFDICEPMSPEVTCLGRIKIKEAHDDKAAHATTASKPGTSAATPKVEKGRCFDTKNQLCTGKRPKGRKKKKVAEKSRCLTCRRRFASKEATDHSQRVSSFVSSEVGETRREKAASLARSLTDLLEDARRHKKERVDYVPSVPPPNSLLLTRGCRRIRDESNFPSRLNIVEQAISNVDVRTESQEIEAPDDEEGSGNANVKNLRTNASGHFSLLDLIGMEDEDSFTSETEDTITTQRTNHAKARARETFEAVEKGDKNKSATEGSSGDRKKESVTEWHALSQMQSPRVVLWQRRSFTELTPITIERMKQKRDHRIYR